jgi:hypothetical protein
MALLIANQPDAAEEVFFTAVRHPLADSQSAAIAEFGMVLADGLSSVQHRGGGTGTHREGRPSSSDAASAGSVAWRSILTDIAGRRLRGRAVHDDCGALRHVGRCTGFAVGRRRSSSARRDASATFDDAVAAFARGGG